MASFGSSAEYGRAPIGSTSSNMRRAVEVIIHSSGCGPDAVRAHSTRWTLPLRRTHRPSAVSAWVSPVLRPNSVEIRHRSPHRRWEVALGDDILAALGHAVIATDLQGTITYWNPAAEEL